MAAVLNEWNRIFFAIFEGTFALRARDNFGQGWICRLPGARENITVCGVAPVPASTHRVS